MYWDRFDIAEAFKAYAHDFGEYRLFTRCNRPPFGGIKTKKYEDLTDNAQAIYDGLEDGTIKFHD